MLAVKKHARQKREDLSHISVVTWNISSSSPHLKERVSKILEIIIEKDPTFICLQSVNDESLHIIQQTLSEKYAMFQVFISEGDGEGSLLLFKKEVAKIKDQPFYYDYEIGDDATDGHLIGCNVYIDGEVFSILTTSLDSDPIKMHRRVEQFKFIKDAIEPMEKAIVCGNFSIYDINEPVESQIRGSKLRDVWRELGMPSKVKNTWAFTKGGKKFRYRTDRIFTTFGKPVRLSLLGIDLVDGAGGSKIKLSEYFGLYSIIYHQ
jgi:hypothetical protein